MTQTYKQFADLIEKIEDEIEFWHVQQDHASDIGRVIRCTEEIESCEAQLLKVYEVAGLLGLSKDVLENIHMMEKEKALA